MNQTVDVLVKNEHNRTLIHEKSFYLLARDLLGEPHVRYSDQDEKQHPTFSKFLKTLTAQTKLMFD